MSSTLGTPGCASWRSELYKLESSVCAEPSLVQKGKDEERMPEDGSVGSSSICIHVISGDWCFGTIGLR